MSYIICKFIYIFLVIFGKNLELSVTSVLKIPLWPKKKQMNLQKEKKFSDKKY